MKFENIEIFNVQGALRGMRNPKNSWSRGDTHIENVSKNSLPKGLKNVAPVGDNAIVIVGPNDAELAQKLIQAGPEHAKFLRQIFITIDITAPLYFWKEFDTYKVGTVANSTSTMHKLADTPITLDCFEMGDYQNNVKVYDREPYNPDTYMDAVWEELIEVCECLRSRYIKTKDIRYWKELIRILPESWLQKRTVTLNYAVLRNMYSQRKNHKLTEWHSFCKMIEELPLAKLFIL
jgi:hypothetical protein